MAFATCQAVNGVSGKSVVSAKSIGYDPQHIDIHYKQIRYRILGGSWTRWHVGQTGCMCAGYGFVLDRFADVRLKGL